MAEQDFTRRRVLGIELSQKGFQNLDFVLALGLGGEERPITVIAPAPEKEHLHTIQPALLRQRHHVGLGYASGINVLVLLNTRERRNAVAKFSRAFIILGIAGVLHLGGEALLDILAFTRQKLPRLIHQGVIGVFVHLAVHARPRTALDLIQQTWPRTVGEHRIGAGTQQKGPLQDGQRLVHRPATGERAEIFPTRLMRAAMFDHTRVIVI